MATLQFLGHSAIKLTLGVTSILIDPCFSEKVFFFKRRIALPLDQVNLQVSAIAYTSSDWDHLDMFSLKFFSLTLPLITPKGFAPFIGRFVPNPVTELEPWESHILGDITVTAVPSQGSNRRLGSIPRKNVLGYIVSGENQSIYVSGDTGYGPHLSEVGKRFKITAACLPIGPDSAKMTSRYLKPVEFVKAAKELGTSCLIPVRREGFQLDDGNKENKAVLELGNLSRLAKNLEVKFLSTGETLAMGA